MVGASGKHRGEYDIHGAGGATGKANGGHSWSVGATIKFLWCSYTAVSTASGL